MILLTFHLLSSPHSHLTLSGRVRPSYANSKSLVQTEVKFIQGEWANLLVALMYTYLSVCVCMSINGRLSLSSVDCCGPGGCPHSRRTDLGCSAGINNALDLSAASNQQRSGSTFRWERIHWTTHQCTSHIIIS